MFWIIFVRSVSTVTQRVECVQRIDIKSKIAQLASSLILIESPTTDTVKDDAGLLLLFP